MGLDQLGPFISLDPDHPQGRRAAGSDDLLKSEEGSMAYKGDQFFEERESPRLNWIKPDVQVMITYAGNDAKILGWIQDISQGGFKIRVERPRDFKDLFQRSEEFHFETFEDFFQLRGQGRMVWVSFDENTAGIRFEQLPDESRRFVDRFLGIFP